MKYISVNRLFDFEFHDAVLISEVFGDHCLKLKANFLNIHRDSEQNHFETDMEILSATITFDEFRLLAYEFGGAISYDENGTLCSVEPKATLTGDSAEARFREQLQEEMCVYDLGVKEGGTYFIDAYAKDPFFTVLITFKNVTVEWDEYKQAAWYVGIK